MNESFRLRRSIQFQAILSTLLFLAATIGTTSSAFLGEPTKHGFEREHSVAVLVGMGLVVFGGMTLLSLYLLLAYYVERVAVVGTAVFVTTVFQKRQFDTAEVEKLTWKTRPAAGRIDFWVADRRTKIELSGYGDEDRLRLIRLFRALIPKEKQADWSLFCQKIALPLRDRRLALVANGSTSPAADGEVVITRARYDRLAAVVLPATVVLAVAYWWATTVPVSFVLPALVGFLWLFLRFSVRPEGERSKSLTATPGYRSMLISLAAMVGSAIFIGVLGPAGVGWVAARTVGFILLAAAIPFYVYGLFRAAKEQTRAAQIAATRAPQQWDEGELARLQSAHGKPAEPAPH